MTDFILQKCMPLTLLNWEWLISAHHLTEHLSEMIATAHF